MAYQNVISLINTIIEKVKELKTSANNFHIITSVLNKIKTHLEDGQPSFKIDIEDLSIFSTFLENILKIIQLLGNEEKIKSYQNNTEFNQECIIEINNNIKKVTDIFQKYELLNFPKDQLDEFKHAIEDLLTDPKIKKQETTKETKSEVVENNTQISALNIKIINEENISILNKFDEYKLDRSDYIRQDPYLEDDLLVCYYGEKNNETKEKIRIMSLNSKSNKNFKRIFSILTTIHHPYLERFVGASIENSNIEIVTLKAGVNLEQLILKKESELYDDSEETFVRIEKGDRTIIASKIAQAMAYLHSRGVMHRILSSSIIYIKKVNKDDDKYEIIPIITNFAYSHLRSRDSLLTMTNMTTNSSTSSFRAPELVDSISYDEKVDVFAFAGILFELLTDLSPNDELKKIDKDVWKLVKDGRRPIIPSYCPNELRQLIEACWAQDSKKRPSFDKIIKYMFEKKLIFPFDIEKKQEIDRFYEENTFTKNITSKCLDLFELIKNNIDFVSHYKSEFSSAKPIIANYQYMLHNSKYSLQKEITSEEKAKIDELETKLKFLNGIIHNVSLDRWLYDAMTNDVDLITNQLNKTMDSIYQLMDKLGIKDIEKYKETANDLVLDYNQLMNEYEKAIKNIYYGVTNHSDREPNEAEVQIQTILDKENEINEFLRKKNLDDQKSDKILITHIRNSIAQFSAFELKEEDYKIETSISEGSTSDVYQGINIKTNKKVAIKILREDLFKTEPKVLIILAREIFALTRLKHKNIPKFYGYIIPKNKKTVWIISEFYEYGSVYKNLSEFNGLQKTQIAYEIAVGMKYIHSQRILHRDLKTSNVLFDSNYSPKIIDFGNSISNINNIGKTMGTGTINYMAPEVRQSDDYGFEADVYSYGALLYELESGKPLKKSFKLTKKMIAKCPSPLKKLITKCCCKNPKERPTFDEIVDLMMKKDNYVMFSGSDEESVISFYEEKELERKNSNF